MPSGGCLLIAYVNFLQIEVAAFDALFFSAFVCDADVFQHLSQKMHINFNKQKVKMVKVNIFC